MKIFLILLLFSQAAVAGGRREELLGHWFFYKKIYQGVEMPEPPEATLRLHFEFLPDGTDYLYWWHEGEDDECKRRGEYHSEGGILVDAVIEVNPNNHHSCSRDPDMQEGKVTRTPFRFLDGELQLFLPLGDETLIYVWKKLEP